MQISPEAIRKLQAEFNELQMSKDEQQRKNSSSPQYEEVEVHEQTCDFGDEKAQLDHPKSSEFHAVAPVPRKKQEKDQMSNGSFAEEVERENSMNDFLANQRRSESQAEGRRRKGSGRKHHRKKSQDRKSSASSRGRVNLTFDEDKISNIHEADESLASGNKRQVDAQISLLNQSINDLANVFDQIDPTHIGKSIKKLNDSGILEEPLQKPGTILKEMESEDENPQRQTFGQEDLGNLRQQIDCGYGNSYNEQPIANPYEQMKREREMNNTRMQEEIDLADEEERQYLEQLKQRHSPQRERPSNRSRASDQDMQQRNSYSQRSNGGGDRNQRGSYRSPARQEQPPARQSERGNPYASESSFKDQSQQDKYMLNNYSQQQQKQPESVQNEFDTPAYQQFQQRESFKKQTSPRNSQLDRDREMEMKMDELMQQQMRRKHPQQEISQPPPKQQETDFGARFYEQQQRNQQIQNEQIQLDQQRQREFEMEEERSRHDYEAEKQMRQTKAQMKIDVDQMSAQERERLMEEKMDQIMTEKMRQQRQGGQKSPVRSNMNNDYMNQPISPRIEVQPKQKFQQPMEQVRQPEPIRQQEQVRRRENQPQMEDQYQRVQEPRQLHEPVQDYRQQQQEPQPRRSNRERSRSGSQGRGSIREIQPQPIIQQQEPPVDKEFMEWQKQKKEFQEWQAFKKQQEQQRQSRMGEEHPAENEQSRGSPYPPQVLAQERGNPYPLEQQEIGNPYEQRTMSREEHQQQLQQQHPYPQTKELSPQREQEQPRQRQSQRESYREPPVEQQRESYHPPQQVTSQREPDYQQNYQVDERSRHSVTQEQIEAENLRGSIRQINREPSPQRQAVDELIVPVRVEEQKPIPTLHPQPQWRMPQYEKGSQQQITPQRMEYKDPRDPQFKPQSRQKSSGMQRMSPAGRYHQFADSRQSSQGSVTGMEDMSYMNGSIVQSDLDQTITQGGQGSDIKSQISPVRSMSNAKGYQGESAARINTLNDSMVDGKMDMRQSSPNRDGRNDRAAQQSSNRDTSPIEMMQRARKAKEQELHLQMQREQEEQEEREMQIEQDKQRQLQILEENKERERVRIEKMNKEAERQRQEEQYQQERERQRQEELYQARLAEEMDRQKHLENQIRVAEEKEKQRLDEIRQQQLEDLREAQRIEQQRQMRRQQMEEIQAMEEQRARQMETQRAKMARDQERFQEQQRAMEESARQRRLDEQRELLSRMKPKRAELVKAMEDDEIHNEINETQQQEFIYKKVSPSPPKQQRPFESEPNEFEIDDPDQYSSTSKTKILNKKNSLYDEVFAEVMKERNPIEALNHIAMNSASDRRFDFLRDDQFFWNRLADAVAQEHHKQHSERKRSSSANRSRNYDQTQTSNSDSRYRPDSRASNGSGVNQYLNRNNSRNRFFNKSRSGSRAGSRASSRASNTTPDRFLNHQDEPDHEYDKQDKAVRKFYKEYQNVIKSQQKLRVSYLSDILTELNFVSNSNSRLSSLLEQQKQNFIIGNLNDTVCKNLFKILCSILSYKPVVSESPQLENKLLTTYLQNLSLNKDQNFQMIDKIATIKRLINRSSYSLDTRQIMQLHKGFQDMYIQRVQGKYRVDGSATKSAQQELGELGERPTIEMNPSLHSSMPAFSAAKRPWKGGDRPSSRAGMGSRGDGEMSQGRIRGRNDRSNTSQGNGGQEFGGMSPGRQRQERPEVRPSSRNRGMPQTIGSGFGAARQSPDRATAANRSPRPSSRTRGMPGGPSGFGAMRPGQSSPSRRHSGVRPSSRNRGMPSGNTSSGFSATKQPSNPNRPTSGMRPSSRNQGMPSPARGGFFSPSKPQQDPNQVRPSSRTRGMPGYNAPAAVKQPITNYPTQSSFVEMDEDAEFGDKYLVPRDSAQSQESVMTLNPDKYGQQSNQPAAQIPISEKLGKSPRDYGERDTYKGDVASLQSTGDPRIYNPSSKNTLAKSKKPAMPQALLAKSPRRANPDLQKSQKQMMNSMGGAMYENFAGSDNESGADEVNDSFGPPKSGRTQQTKVQNEPRYGDRRPTTSTEPICVLKIELDKQHVEEIRVYKGDDPHLIVEKFGNYFNLSDNAKRRLLEQIHGQIELNQQGQY